MTGKIVLNERNLKLMKTPKRSTAIRIFLQKYGMFAITKCGDSRGRVAGTRRDGRGGGAWGDMWAFVSKVGSKESASEELIEFVVIIKAGQRSYRNVIIH